MEIYNDPKHWEMLSRLPYHSMKTDYERAVWREHQRLLQMTDEELYDEVTGLDQLIEEIEEPDVKAILKVVSKRYWETYSERLADRLGKIMFQ